MANTYTQCHFHIVFAVKNRESLIQVQWKDKLESYITGIVQNNKHKLLAIKAMPDHIHILIGYNLNSLIPNLVEQIKTSSNAYVNKNSRPNRKFEWQYGYGAFTHSRSNVQTVINYIVNQEQHHMKKSFKQEFIEILQKNEIEYDPKYLFDFFE